MKEFLDYLNTISPIQKDTFEELKEFFKLVQLYKNDFFAKEGEFANDIGFLNEGIIRAFYMDDHGKEYNKQFFMGPSLVGTYSSLLTKQTN